MRLLILSSSLLFLPSLALAQFGGFGQVNATTPTFNGSSSGVQTASRPSSRLGSSPGIITPGGGRGGPIITAPTIYRSPQPRVSTRTGGGRPNRTGNCPRTVAAPTKQEPAAGPARTTASSGASARPGR